MTTPGLPFGGRSGRAHQPVLGCALALLIVGAGAIGWFGGSARASPEVLREAYAPATWDNSFANVWVNGRAAQSFVARTSFLLTHLELFMFDQPESNPPDILQVFVTADAGNVPGAVLASTARQGQQNWTWIPFGFYPWVNLIAGRRYWIVAEDAQPRPKAYEWAMNSPGGYASGEAKLWDDAAGAWTNGTGEDLFFKAFGISGPSLLLEVEPGLRPVDPGAVVPVDLYFNNSGNDVASTARIDVDLAPGLGYVADDAALEDGVPMGFLAWTFQDLAPGPHRMTVWVEVLPNRTYFDGQSLFAWAFLNYTDADGAAEAASQDVATVSVLVPVIRVAATPVPAHVAPGETFNFTVSFFNLASGTAAFLWLNATPGPRIAILGDDAASAGGTSTGPTSWEFRNVTAQTYVFNVTVRADPAAWPGDRLTLRLDAAYTDGAGHSFASRTAAGVAAIHGPSVSVEAIASRSAARPGDVVTITVYANNTGDETASRVWLNLTLPLDAAVETASPPPTSNGAGWARYEMADLAPGPRSASLGLRVAAGTLPGARLETLAGAALANASGVALRPSTSAVSTVVVTPRFSLDLESTVTDVAPGDTVDLVLRWNNTGNEAATRLWMNLTLPDKALLVTSTVPWTFTNGTTYAWSFAPAAPGEGIVSVRLEVSARVVDQEVIRAHASLAFEREDGIVWAAGSVDADMTARIPGGLSDAGWEVVFLWISALAAIFLLFLLLGYMDVLPRRRATIDDVFLLHNSGILICHYSTTLRPDVDSDIASGMLMAVRNFVADALRSKNGNLQELKYGEHRIHMVHGLQSVLVVFARGRNGRNLEARMAEVLRNIEAAYSRVLESWSGRTEEFKGVEEYILRLVSG